MKTAPETCPACGTQAAADQEYCLGCGSRIVPDRRVSTIGIAWERRLGRYPGDWIWVSLLLLLVAAGSAAAGIVAGRETGTVSGSETIVATSPVVPAPPAPPALKPAPKPSPAPKAAPSTGLAVWPARNGYTIVLASIPARGTGLADARAKAKEAQARGLRSAGILDSNHFASLHPGYYVVFVGVYASLEEAQIAVRRVSSRFPNAYARQITR